MSKEINTFTLRSPKALIEELKRHSKIKGISTNALILQILWDWLKANKT